MHVLPAGEPRKRPFFSGQYLGIILALLSAHVHALARVNALRVRAFRYGLQGQPRRDGLEAKLAALLGAAP